MDKAIRTIVDLVEGRLTAKEFQQAVYNDASLERTLNDESLRWHDTYIKTSPYYFLFDLDYDDPAGRLDAQGAMELFLQRKGIPFQSDRRVAELYDILLAAQPKWLTLDTAYLQRHVLPDAGDRTGQALTDWLKDRLLQMFRFHEHPPKWIQSPAWPISGHGPMYFLGQIKLANCEYFHDEAAAYLFFDPATGETKTVIQVY
jgi:hypothetical protein